MSEDKVGTSLKPMNTDTTEAWEKDTDINLRPEAQNSEFAKPVIKGRASERAHRPRRGIHAKWGF